MEPIHLLNPKLSRPMGKPTICICENKDADQLRGNREADQRLCFRYSDSTIPPLLDSKILSFQPASATVHTGLSRTCSETTLLVFPRGGSINENLMTCEEVTGSKDYREVRLLIISLLYCSTNTRQQSIKRVTPGKCAVWAFCL